LPVSIDNIGHAIQRIGLPFKFKSGFLFLRLVDKNQF
jgi:hypothetical protein